MVVVCCRRLSRADPRPSLSLPPQRERYRRMKRKQPRSKARAKVVPVSPPEHMSQQNWQEMAKNVFQKVIDGKHVLGHMQEGLL